MASFSLCPYIFTSVRINLPLFSTVLPSNRGLFLSCRPFVVITFSTGLVSVEITSVSWLGQLTVLSCRPFVVITTFSTGLVGVEVTFVSWLRQLTVGV